MSFFLLKTILIKVIKIYADINYRHYKGVGMIDRINFFRNYKQCNSADLIDNQIHANSIFYAENKNVPDIDDEDVEISKSEKLAYEFIYILENEDLISDDAFLSILDYIKTKDIDVEVVLTSFRFETGEDLLFNIETLDNIKQSTKDRYFKTFKNELYKLYDYSDKFENINQKTKIGYKNITHETDSYNIVQRDENILEVTNLTTNEKKIIDFEKLLPRPDNGLEHIIDLKMSIRELPGEILFQIPEEISFMIHQHSAIVSNAEEDENGVLTSFYAGEDGSVMLFNELGAEIFTSSSDQKTLIHEIAHAIFYDSKFFDTLNNNKELVEIFNQAQEKYNNENKYDAYLDGYREDGYWSVSISELGAEVMSALFTNNTNILDSIDKYAPGAIKLVLDTYKQRLQATDRHNKIDIDTFNQKFNELYNDEYDEEFIE